MGIWVEDEIEIGFESIGRGWAWGVQIKFVPPSNIVGEGGRTILRWRRGG
jgi:hypothetical protein